MNDPGTISKILARNRSQARQRRIIVVLTAGRIFNNFKNMITIQAARQLAISLPEVEESSHFNTPDFRVKNKIFATIHSDKHYMMVRLSLTDQSVFCTYDKTVIFPVPGGWGRKGCTFINLKKVRKDIFKDALETAWKTIAPAKLVAKYFPVSE
jgi:hypothetical protein